MNVKPGDIAMVLAKDSYGALVTVRGTIPGQFGFWECETLSSILSQAAIPFAGAPVSYQYDSPKRLPPGSIVEIHDGVLRPLRDDPGVDEMIKRAGYPRPVYLKVPEWVK